MILVSIYIKEEKLFIQVKHKIIYEVEKEFQNKRTQSFRTILLFTHLFMSVVKLGVREIFQLRKTGHLHSKIPSVSPNCIEGK